MPSNNTGIQIGYLAGRYPGKLGHLYSPGAQRGPFEFMPYALDNGVYGKREAWREEEFYALLDWARLRTQKPLWVIVPDVVADRVRTLARWQEHWSRVAAYGWPLAFAVQDGMGPEDVPGEAEFVFVGGSTEWKWRTAETWCKQFPRVHVGRVNSFRRLLQCERMGAVSCDGTGWTRGDQKQWRGLQAFLDGQRDYQGSLFSDLPPDALAIENSLLGNLS